MEDALLISQPDIVQKAGIIQFFEMTFELGWKTMKDYLHEQGFWEIQSPRDTIKKAFQVGLISDNAWTDLLKDRNLTSHIYDEKKIIRIQRLIAEKYFPLLSDLNNALNTKL